MNNKAAIAIAIVVVAAVGIGAAFMLMDGSEPEKTSFSVIYDGNGGECRITDDMEYGTGDIADVKFSPEPTKPGYVFLGWSYDKENGDLDLFENTGKDTVKMGEEDLTLYAVYRNDTVYQDVGTYMKLDAKMSMDGYPSLSCIGYIKMSAISKTDNSAALKMEIKMDLMDGVERINTINKEEIVDAYSGNGFDSDTISCEYGTYLYKGENVPVRIVKTVESDRPGEIQTVYEGLYDGLFYCMTYEYEPGSEDEGMHMAFELSDYELRYEEPRNDGKYHVFYDGNGGLCDTGDSISYNKGDKVDVRFDVVPYKEGKRFCGWSTHSDSPFPEYDSTLEKDTLTMGSEDITLYAVYSDYLNASGVGSTFDYEMTETFENDPDYKCVVSVKAEITEISSFGIIYSLKGTETVQDNGRTSVKEIDTTFDTSKDAWGYNDGNMKFAGSEEKAVAFEGVGVPVTVIKLDGTEFIESCTYSYGHYDDILYESVYTSELEDGTEYCTVTVLKDFNLV